MSELTTPIRIDIPGVGTIESADLYLKSEADEVIAELEERIVDGDKDFEMANNQNEKLLKIVCHHKYKRCLAMARMLEHIFYPVTDYKANWRVKWHKRWLELAEKFKEAK